VSVVSIGRRLAQGGGCLVFALALMASQSGVASSGTTTVGQVSPAPFSGLDLFARDQAGNLWRYTGSNEGFLPRVKIGIGWNSMTALIRGDLNCDGYDDLAARDSAGNLWLYPGNATGGFKPRVRIGTGWNAMTAIVSIGSSSGAYVPDIVARDQAGNLWFYSDTCPRGLNPPVRVGTGWNVMRLIAGGDDNNHDGTNPDLMSIDTRGNLWFSAGNNGIGVLHPQLAGIGWNDMTALVEPGNFNGDAYDDLITRDTSGRLWLFPGGPNNTLGHRVLIGIGWNVMTAIVGQPQGG
jgi:hypothetical protein